MRIVQRRIPAECFRSRPAGFAPVVDDGERVPGRPPKLDADQVARAEQWRAAGIPVPTIAARLAVSVTTIYCRVPAPVVRPKGRPRGHPADGKERP